MEEKEYQDPDYPVIIKQEESQSPTKAGAKLEKARNILSREIDAEIAVRETELSSIDENMWRARKVLHRLRCNLLQQHYGTSIALDCRETQSLPQMSSMLRNKQTRLHPAQRRLTGATAVTEQELFLTSQSLNTTRGHNTIDENPNITLQREIKPAPSIASEAKPASEAPPTKVPRHIEPQSTKKVLTLDQTSRSRQKHKYRIIIGNTSKYSPRASLSERCSHKWLLYVRTAHDQPSAIIKQVTIRLHESYAPNHVCQLRSPPYQISRRGWGEFPAKLELHFALPELNPPATVEHVIKLDKRCTGLQTLGAETIVEVWLYSNQEMLKYAIKEEVNNVVKDQNASNDKMEKEKDKQFGEWNNFFSTEMTELDIDEMIIKPVKSKVETLTDSIDNSVGNVDENMDHEFYNIEMNGIDKEFINNDTNLFDNEFEAIIENDIDIKPKINLLEKTLKETGDKGTTLYRHISNDHCYIPRKELPSLISKVDNKLQNTKKHRFDLGEVVSKMICIRSAVNFLLGKIPLVSDDAAVYKSMFPFMMKSKEQYWSMSDIRRKYAEWSRAKIINSILKKHFHDKSSIWRTKQILYFARFHGYLPTLSQPNMSQEGSSWSKDEVQWELHKNFKQLFPTTSDINSGSVFDENRFKNVKVKDCQSVKDGNSVNARYSEENVTVRSETVNVGAVLPCDSEDEIDVTSVAREKKEEAKSPDKKRLEVLPLEDDDEKLRCYYIEKICSDIGIELKNEDVGNGFSHSAVHRVMLSAVRSFVSEVLRSSLVETRLQGDIPSVWTIDTDSCIGVQHIFQSLKRSDRLNVLTSESLYTPPEDYSERL